MSQHDMTVDNGAGLAVRTDINLALKALASQSSGASAPSPSFPAQMWADTGTGRLKQRDSANTMWIDRGILDAPGEIQTLASSALTDIGAATSEVITVTGTTTITSLGTAVAGVIRKVRFTGILTLTYNATSLILPGSANILTAVGDSAEFLSLGSGNWQCLRYNPASGLYGRSNILGAVGQSSGVPTGALIERGSNANGEYARFADGLQICTFKTNSQIATNTAVGALFAINAATLTFPAAFIALPVVCISAHRDSTSNNPIWPTLSVPGAGTNPTTTTVQVGLISAANGATSYISYAAIGRWF